MGGIYTNGFKSLTHLQVHFLKHAARLGISTIAEYERRADEFLGQPVKSPILSFIRPWCGDDVRFNSITEEFGILTVTVHIKTYYLPDPVEHGCPDNMQYFLSEKAKA